MDVSEPGMPSKNVPGSLFVHFRGNMATHEERIAEHRNRVQRELRRQEYGCERKTCPRCGADKDVGEFPPWRSYRSACKACVREAGLRRFRREPEAVRASNRRYKARNRRRCNRASLAHYWRNRDRYVAAMRERRQKVLSVGTK